MVGMALVQTAVAGRLVDTVEMLTFECPQVRVSLAPVRAVVEIQQGHLHDQTINLLPQEKVKQ